MARRRKAASARAAWQARELGIPIDTFALAGRKKPAVHLDSTSIPALAFTGEQFPIDFVVTSPTPAPPEVELSAEGQTLGKTAGCTGRRNEPDSPAHQPEHARRA